MSGLALNGKTVDLEQLKAELAAAGVTVGALGTADGALITYDAQGHVADLPANAAAVVAAHTPSTALHDLLVTALQSTVGVTLVNLTQVQRLALIAGLLYKAGGVDRTGAIRPLNQWLG